MSRYRHGDPPPPRVRPPAYFSPEQILATNVIGVANLIATEKDSDFTLDYEWPFKQYSQKNTELVKITF